MGWMHDTLSYFEKEPIYRKYHHHQLTFSSTYAYTEDFVLPLSHDEVVHGKKSLLNKMPGDDWQKFANLRALYGFMWAHPGKKLLFMGGEFGQASEWNHDAQLPWDIAGVDRHARRTVPLGALHPVGIVAHEDEQPVVGRQVFDACESRGVGDRIPLAPGEDRRADADPEDVR